MAYMIQKDTYIFKSSCCAVNSAKGGGGGWGREKGVGMVYENQTFKK